MAGRGGKNRYRSGQDEQDQAADALDAIAEFEDFRSTVLPKLQQKLKDGATPEELRKFAQSYLTARQITVALTSDDESAALRAIDSLTHQNEGKPKERQEVEHRFGKLPENELDALLESKLTEVAATTSAPKQKRH